MVARRRTVVPLVATVVALWLIAPTLVGSAWAGVVRQPETSRIGTQLTKLAASDPVPGAWFGGSVAVSGDTVVVGAFAPFQAVLVGRAYVFSKTPTGWHQTVDLQGPDTVAGDEFGGSVAVSGDAVVVGAPGHDAGAGAVYVFTYAGMGWRATELRGSDTVAKDHFGDSVAIFGNTVVVGAFHHASGAGRVYVFTRTITGWHQTAELKGPETIGPTDGLGDGFGRSVAVWGSSVVVGAGLADEGAGRAYVFDRAAVGWQRVASLVGSDTAIEDGFGDSVAVFENTVVVGADYHASGTGAVYVFTNDGAGWHQSEQLEGSDTTVNDGFGNSLALSGSTLAVGGFAHASSAGRAYMFTKTSVGWHQIAELKGSDTVANDEFGYAVGVSGDSVVVGAPYHGAHAGSAYLFRA